mmetsp:Transcript_130152/g.417675  ORF Transcript_130152/g.417675 Transcript_130152/m.417675 type:complete len:521 (-) Transcript_130152:94-1656(-)
MYASAVFGSHAVGGSSRSGLFGGASPSASAPPRLGGNNLASMTGACGIDEESRKAKYAYNGPGKGGWVQEVKYNYVGPDGGEFEKMTVKVKTANYTLIASFLVAAGIIGFLAFGAMKSEAPSDVKSSGVDGAATAFSCLPDGLDQGERVLAAADIAFQPAGFVRQGALGTVITDSSGSSGTSSGEREVSVSWDDIPGLKNSKVARDMLTRSLDVGLRVEAVAEMVYDLAPGQNAEAASFDIADLVRASQDLGGVKKGTYGTIVAIPPSAGLEPGHAVVRFVNQLDTVKVQEAHVVRAPQVGDHVRALADIVAKAGEKPVKVGTVGKVVAVTPAENGFAFRFTVDWRGHDRSAAWEAELEPLNGSEGSPVPQGTKGKVMQTLPLQEGVTGSEQLFVVAWDGLPGPGAMVNRGRLKKAAVWSADKQIWCDQSGPNGASGSESSGGITSGSSSLYDCQVDDPSTWSVGKASWCCDNRKTGCDALKRPSDAGPIALQPLAIPASFDPAPRTYVPTAEPAWQSAV